MHPDRMWWSRPGGRILQHLWLCRRTSSGSAQRRHERAPSSQHTTEHSSSPTGTRSASRSDAPAPWAYWVTGGTQSWRSSMQRYVVFGHDCRGRLLQYLRTSTERIHECGPWFPVGYHRDPR